MQEIIESKENQKSPHISYIFSNHCPCRLLLLNSHDVLLYLLTFKLTLESTSQRTYFHTVNNPSFMESNGNDKIMHSDMKACRMNVNHLQRSVAKVRFSIYSLAYSNMIKCHASNYCNVANHRHKYLSTAPKRQSFMYVIMEDLGRDHNIYRLPHRAQPDIVARPRISMCHFCSNA